jgi:hypothetical protein
MSSLLSDKKMNRASDELNYMGCNIFREGRPLVQRPDEPSAAHATAKPPRSRKLAMLPLTHSSSRDQGARRRRLRYRPDMATASGRTSEHNDASIAGELARQSFCSLMYEVAMVRR